MSKQAILFPGQGSHAVGMGRDVAELSSRAADIFRRADDILGLPLSEFCFRGPADQLECTDIQQPAIFVTSVAIWHAVQERGARLDAFSAAAGLSLGEYTALHVAGAVEFEAALRLVHRRGQLMQQAAEANPSGMVSLVGADEELARRLCERASEGEVLCPANFNGPGQVVISGAKGACERALRLADEFAIRAVPLKVAGAFHSPLMADAAAGLRLALQATSFARPTVPVLANVSAAPHGDAASIRDALERQVTAPVLWQRSMERLVDEGFDRFVEIGTGRVLTGLMRRINRSVQVTSIGRAEDLAAELTAAGPRST